MGINELSKIVAEYMGQEWDVMPNGKLAIGFTKGMHTKLITDYYLSLDPFIPVWEKLGIRGISTDTFMIGSTRKYQVWFRQGSMCNNYETTGLADSLGEAALLATAKAIQEIDSKNKG